MVFIATDEPLAAAAVKAVRTGDLPGLKRLLDESPMLATARLGTNGPKATSRTLLHVATDWPGHYPNGAATVAALVGAGAEVNARFFGPAQETPLHWAASSDDVGVLDTLLDAGADIEAPGAVIAGGSPLRDATAFGQWRAARRLVDRGAHPSAFDAAALGLMDRLEDLVASRRGRGSDQISDAFWAACHGGQRDAAEYLLSRGAELNRMPGWERLTPLDVAARSAATDVIGWLHEHGAKTAGELRGHC